MAKGKKSVHFDMIKRRYNDGTWTKSMILALAKAGKLTEAELRDIVGAEEDTAE